MLYIINIIYKIYIITLISLSMRRFITKIKILEGDN